jgi:hypothetical protein
VLLLCAGGNMLIEITSPKTSRAIDLESNKKGGTLDQHRHF